MYIYIKKSLKSFALGPKITHPLPFWAQEEFPFKLQNHHLQHSISKIIY